MSQVTVIMPLFNKGTYVRRALASVFMQTFQDYEVIVIDDGSTDNGPEIVLECSDTRVRMIHQDNAGPGAARNLGILESKGRYVTFLDADDEWLPEYLENSFKILEDSSECDVCISAWYQDHSDHGLFKDSDICEIYRSHGLVIESGPINAPELNCHRNLLLMWSTNTVFIRKSVFLKNYRFYDASRYTYGEDYYLWIQLAFNHSFYRNTKPLAWYHNEVSDLGRGSYVKKPLEAFLLWPETILFNSIPERRKIVRKWLVRNSLKSAHIRLGVGQFENAVFLVKKFPDMVIVAPLKSIFLLLKIFLCMIGCYRPSLKD